VKRVESTQRMHETNRVDRHGECGECAKRVEITQRMHETNRVERGECAEMV
jgi:hypothetical protein